MYSSEPHKHNRNSHFHRANPQACYFCQNYFQWKVVICSRDVNGYHKYLIRNSSVFTFVSIPCQNIETWREIKKKRWIMLTILHMTFRETSKSDEINFLKSNSHHDAFCPWTISCKQKYLLINVKSSSHAMKQLIV